MSAVAVAIVSYNTRDVLRGCLESVVREAPAELVVADNGSTDGSVAMVRERFPSAVVDVDPRNLGYGAAANRAIARCTAEHVLLLNSDTVLRPGALAALGAYLDGHPAVGMVGPRLVNPDGSLQPSCHHFPTPLVTLLEYSALGDLAGALPGVRARYAGSWAHDRARRMDWVTGAALAIRRSAFAAVHGFDERFFLYFEEVDLAFRLRRAGWETHFAPVTEVTHIGGASTAQRFSAMYAQQFAALLQFYRHHHPAWCGRARAAVRLCMASKLAWYSLAYVFVRDRARRAELDRSLPVWWRVFRAPTPGET